MRCSWALGSRLKTATGVALGPVWAEVWGPERGMREATLVPRDAPAPALPQRGREEFGSADRTILSFLDGH